MKKIIAVASAYGRELWKPAVLVLFVMLGQVVALYATANRKQVMGWDISPKQDVVDYRHLMMVYGAGIVLMIGLVVVTALLLRFGRGGGWARIIVASLAGVAVLFAAWMQVKDYVASENYQSSALLGAFFAVIIGVSLLRAWLKLRTVRPVSKGRRFNSSSASDGVPRQVEILPS